MAAELPSKERDDLKSILEHVRSHFQYHAGQRLIAIRYFFLAYAAFVAAYVSAVGKPDVPLYALSGVALLLTLAFWGLDVRNVQMVEINEDGLKEIEKLVTDRYHLEKFEMAKRWHDERGQVCTYGVIVHLMFGAFTLLSAAAAIRDFVQAFCHR
jgi:hypothetical protein